jgi:PAS domain S-box-containing protein/putative nucleotidyltransferase with HDIG domain
LVGNHNSQSLKGNVRKLHAEDLSPMEIPWTEWSKDKEKFRGFVENLPLPVSMINGEGRYEYINPKFTEVFGYTLSDIPTGRAWFEKAYPDASYRKEAVSAWVDDLERSREGEFHPRTFMVTCKNGTEKHIRFRSASLPEGKQHLIYEDVTEASVAEKTLKQNEEKYRNILASMEEGYFELDLTGSFTFFNTAVSRILGYPPEELMGMNSRQYMDEGNAKKTFKTFDEVYETGRPRQAFGWEIVRKDGTKRFVETSVSLIRNEKDQACRFRGIMRDVTENKRAEEALRESEKRYRQLVNHAPAGIYEVDFFKRKFVTVNDVMCEYTGYAREELMSLGPLEILDEPSRKTFTERVTRVLSGERVPETVEYKIRRKDGRVLWVVLNVKLVYENGFPKGATVVVHNITERKQAEEALRQSEEKYRLLVDHANDAIFIAQDGVIKFPNPRTLEILGYSHEELSGISYADLVHPEERHLIEEIGQKIAKGKATSASFSLRVRNRSGNEIWAAISSVPIMWEESPATLNFVRDITLQKKAEGELNETINKLRKITGATIQAMAQTVEVRDPYTAGHQKRVADLARAIATTMGLQAGQIDGIRMAGAIHDIGKISVPAEILSKPGLLSPIEFSLIKTHPQVGYEILKDIEFPWNIAHIVLQHHERLDGSGYPNSLSGEQILLEARIIAVADVVEAMASHRPYRPTLGMDKALDEISTNKGRIYDRGVVDACLRLFAEQRFSFR